MTLGSGDSAKRPIERLPFRVAVASEDQLEAIAQTRSKAYGRHLPTMQDQLARPEPADTASDCLLVAASSPLDGSILGSFRMQLNHVQALQLEMSVELPARYQGALLAEIVRLNIPSNPGAAAVRAALFKAVYLCAGMLGVKHVVVAGRRPVDRIYEGLLFTDIAEKGAMYPMAHVRGIPHRVMSLEVQLAEERWRQGQHPLYRFMIATEHPDIDLSAVDVVPWRMGPGARWTLTRGEAQAE
jgi:hypothetical protein